MLRAELRNAGNGLIAKGQLDLERFGTLGEVRRRLLTDQSALRELIADCTSQLNIDGWQRDLDLIDADLQNIASLIEEYGERAQLA
jgi:hypothetical protein